MKLHPTYARDDRGVTVAELTVVLGLMVAVVSVVFLALEVSTRIADSTAARSVASDEVRATNRRLVEELRQAQEIEDGRGAFATAEARRVAFYADIDHDSAPERVTYYVDGRSIMRTVAQPASVPVTLSTGWLAESTPMVLLTNLAPTFTGSIFTYKTGGSTSTTVTTSAQLPNIALVNLHIINAARSGNVTSTVEENASVKVRVIRSEIN